MSFVILKCIPSGHMQLCIAVGLCGTSANVTSTVDSPLLAQALTLNSGKLLATLGINQRLRRHEDALCGGTSLDIRKQL